MSGCKHELTFLQTTFDGDEELVCSDCGVQLHGCV